VVRLVPQPLELQREAKRWPQLFEQVVEVPRLLVLPYPRQPIAVVRRVPRALLEHRQAQRWPHPIDLVVQVPRLLVLP
jgi:hypothetical protein